MTDLQPFTIEREWTADGIPVLSGHSEDGSISLKVGRAQLITALELVHSALIS